MIPRNVYGPTFYRQIGFGDDLFMYQTVGQAIGVVFSLGAIILIDIIGRRPLIIFGALMLVVCNVIIGSIGPKQNITSAEEGAVVASIMLLLSGTKISFQMGACEFVSPNLCSLGKLVSYCPKTLSGRWQWSRLRENTVADVLDRLVRVRSWR